MLRLKFPFVAIFIVVFAAPARGAILLDKVAAVVNQDVITWSELYRDMELDAVPAVKAMSAKERENVFKGQESHFLQSLINQKLELQQAASDGLSVSDQEISDAINGIKKKYSMSDSELKESLKKEGYSFEEYRKKLGQQILISKVIDRDVRSKIVVTDADVRKYINDHRKGLEDAGSYHISQIFFRMPENADEKAGLEKKAETILEKIHNGESFAELAKEYSEDPSADSGGDLGFIKKNQLDKDFREAMSKMKPGEVSRPFWNSKGLHIIKLDGETDTGNMKGIEDKARDELSRRLFSVQYEAWLKTLREKAFISVKL